MHEQTMVDGTTERELMTAGTASELKTKMQRRYEKALNDPRVVEMRQMKGEIVLWPNPILRNKCGPTTFSGSPLKSIIDTMFEVMKKYGGIGLAAVQIGIDQNFFVCNITGKPEDNMVFIDPVISEKRGWQENIEGCLSFPNVKISRKRAKTCIVEAKDIDKNPIRIEATGLLAVVFQHEIEHNLGQLFIDGMHPTDALLNKKVLELLKVNKKIDEIEIAKANVPD